MIDAGHVERVIENPARVSAVRSLGFMAAAREEVLDRLTALALRLTGAHGVALTLLDDREQRVASKAGFGAGIDLPLMVPVGDSVCRYVVETGRPVAIDDTRSDARLSGNRLVNGGGWGSYAGAPIRLSTGQTVGALCLVNGATRHWRSDDIDVLAELAGLASAELDRLSTRSMLERIRFHEVPAPMLVFELETRRILDANDAALAQYGYARSELVSMRADDLRPPAAVPQFLETLALQRHGCSARGVAHHRRRDGTILHVEITSYGVTLDGRNCVVAMPLDITERRAAEHEQLRTFEALRRSEDKFRTLFEGAAVAMAVENMSGQIIACNAALQRMLGYGAELVGMTLEDFTHPDDWPSARRQLDRVRAGEVDRLQLSKRYVCRDGTVKWARATVSRIPDVGGGGQRLLVVIEDVTETRELEAEHRRRESHFQSLIENASDLISILAEDGTILYDSPSVERVLGYSRGDLKGTPALELVHPEDRPEVAKLLLEKLSAPGSTGSITFRCRHRGGDWKWMESTARNLLDDPAVEGIVVNSRDVTQHREVEHRLRHATAASPAVLFTIALEDRVMTDAWVSENVRDMLGYEPEDVRARTWWTENVHPEDREAVIRATDRLFEQDTFSHEHRFRRADGSYIWLRAQMRVLRDVQGEPIELVGSCMDATDFRQLQDELNQAMKMEAVGRLAGGVAHDFNNILTAITGHSELLLADLPEHDPMRADMEEIRTAADRAATLTRQLLAFSRKQVLRPEVLDPGQVVTGMKRMLRRVVSENIELVADAPTGLGLVQADRTQLEQVLVNLVVNARDAMPDGGRLTVDIEELHLEQGQERDEASVPAGDYLVLSISDTGSGIAPEVRARIFEPFFTTKKDGKGTGLGLSTVYGIVKQSDGFIWVDSELGKGTTFRIQLPCVTAAAPTAESTDTSADAPHGTETILLVEDDDAVRTLAVRALERLGYTVLEAANGGEALIIARQHAGRLDLLLTDMIMPHMSGRDLAAELRQGRPDLKVLLMSGYSEEAIVSRGVVESAEGFLEKPFTWQVLAAEVRRALRARGSRIDRSESGHGRARTRSAARIKCGGVLDHPHTRAFEVGANGSVGAGVHCAGEMP